MLPRRNRLVATLQTQANLKVWTKNGSLNFTIRNQFQTNNIESVTTLNLYIGQVSLNQLDISVLYWVQVTFMVFSLSGLLNLIIVQILHTFWHVSQLKKISKFFFSSKHNICQSGHFAYLVFFPLAKQNFSVELSRTLACRLRVSIL